MASDMNMAGPSGMLEALGDSHGERYAAGSPPTQGDIPVRASRRPPASAGVARELEECGH